MNSLSNGEGSWWQSGNTLASDLWGRGSVPDTASSGKAGSCLPMVGKYRTLTNCMYWFPLPFQLPVVIWPVQCWKHVKPQINKSLSNGWYVISRKSVRFACIIHTTCGIICGNRHWAKHPCPSPTMRGSYVTLWHRGETSICPHSPCVAMLHWKMPKAYRYVHYGLHIIARNSQGGIQTMNGSGRSGAFHQTRPTMGDITCSV